MHRCFGIFAFIVLSSLLTAQTACEEPIYDYDFEIISPAANTDVIFGTGIWNNPNYILSGANHGWFNVMNDSSDVNLFDLDIPGLQVGCEVQMSIFLRKSFGTANINLSLLDDTGAIIDEQLGIDLPSFYQEFVLSGVTNTASVRFLIHFNSTGGSGADVCAEDLVITQSCPGPSVDFVMSQTVCGEEDFDPIAFTSPVAGASIEWFNDNTAIGALGPNGIGNIASFASAASQEGDTAEISVVATLNGCAGDTTFFNLIIAPQDMLEITYGDNFMCVGPSTASPDLGNYAGGTFTYNAINGGLLDWNNTTGDINLANSDFGTYELIYNSTTSPFSQCPTTDTLSIELIHLPVADFFFDDYCQDAVNPMPQFINGGVSGEFSSPSNSLAIYPLTGEVNLLASEVGSYEVINELSSDWCPTVLSSDSITIHELPNLDQVSDVEFCHGDVVEAIIFDSSPNDGIITWTSDTDFGIGLSGDTALPSFMALNTDDDSMEAEIVLEHVTAFGCTGPTVDFNLTIHPLPVVSWTVDSTHGCDPMTVQFIENSPSSIQSCEWDFGNNTSSISCGTQTAIYSAGLFDVSLELTSTDGCVDSLVMPNQIEVTSQPEVSFVPSPTTISELTNTPIQFFNFSTLAIDYVWDFGDQNSSSAFEPVNNYTGDLSEYEVILWAYNGICSDSGSFIIDVRENPLVFIPSAFSPNGDGQNDAFCPFVSNPDLINLYEFQVFDRWGHELFLSKDYEEQWNGESSSEYEYFAPDAIYSWALKIRFVNEPDIRLYKGIVTMLR